MTDENRDAGFSPDIEENWVKLRKKYGAKVEDLKTKGSTIIRRSGAEVDDSNCDIDPNDTSAQLASSSESMQPESGAAIVSNDKAIDDKPMTNVMAQTGTPNAPLLRRSTPWSISGSGDIGEESSRRGDIVPAPTGRGLTAMPVGEISDGPDRNAVELLRGIKEGIIDPDALEMEERRIVVKALKESGQTQDSIAELLKVCRKTVVNDYKWIREQAALQVLQLDQYLLAGEVYEVAQTLVRRALSEKKFRTASRVMRDMVEMLQDLGVMYRAPRQTIQGNLTMYGRLRQSGYGRYSRIIEGEQEGVVNVLDKLMEVLGQESKCNEFG